MSIFTAIRNTYWAVVRRLHPAHRHHLIDTGLEPGWYDEDTLILHGCFAMLGRYIKQMGGVEEIEAFNRDLRLRPKAWGDDGVASAAQADRQHEALVLWGYWTKQHPSDEARLEELTEQLYGQGYDAAWSEDREASHAELWALENKIAEDEQAMLRRLIDIRTSLWT